MLLDQIDALSTQIATLTARIDELLAAMEPQPRPDQPHPPGGAGTVADGARESTTIERLDEIPGIGPGLAQVILAEIGLDMSRFPTAAHLVSWAKLCPRTIQSGAIQRGGKTGKGNPYLKGALGEAAAAAAKTNTFLGERYRRIVKRRGKLKALVAVARSILVIIWQHAQRPHRPVPRPRRRLPHHPDQHRTQNTQLRHATNGDGLPRHPPTRRLIQICTGTTPTRLRKLRRVTSPAHSPG